MADPNSPVLDLITPDGQCTGTLIAPNLLVTARHCVAATIDGSFSCSPQGDLMTSSNGAGQMGNDEPVGAISVYTNAQVSASTVLGAPAAVGQQIISTGSLTVCRDDIAFVVLDRSIPGITPAAIRLQGTTTLNESVDSWGYGLTSTPREATALRVRTSVEIVGVGPDSPTSTSQLAPLRAVRLGPDDITCNGDSGGPITSTATGAVIAIASLGNEASFSSPACTDFGTPDTTGPRLGAYGVLALQAFAAAGATPTLESGGPAPEGGPPLEGGSISPESAPQEMPGSYAATGGSCSVGFTPSGRLSSLGALAMTLAAAAGAVGRRRR